MHETVKRTDQKQALHQLKCLMGAMVEEASLKKCFIRRWGRDQALKTAKSRAEELSGVHGDWHFIRKRKNSG